jgi:pyruvate/2-oxoglutarate dehydrogenase complex dihydrolipoamide dehydrogenase (E3) component
VKAKVTLVESHKMGGDCLNYGCVPSKALIKTATLAHRCARDDYGIEAREPHVRLRAGDGARRRVMRDIEPHDSVERYTGLGVDVQQGRAKIVDPWTWRSRSTTAQAGADHAQHRHRHRRAALRAAAAGLDEVGY